MQNDKSSKKCSWLNCQTLFPIAAAVISGSTKTYIDMPDPTNLQPVVFKRLGQVALGIQYFTVEVWGDRSLLNDIVKLLKTKKMRYVGYKIKHSKASLILAIPLLGSCVLATFNALAKSKSSSQQGLAHQVLIGIGEGITKFIFSGFDCSFLLKHFNLRNLSLTHFIAPNNRRLRQLKQLVVANLNWQIEEILIADPLLEAPNHQWLMELSKENFLESCAVSLKTPIPVQADKFSTLRYIAVRGLALVPALCGLLAMADETCVTRHELGALTQNDLYRTIGAIIVQGLNSVLFMVVGFDSGKELAAYLLGEQAYSTSNEALLIKNFPFLAMSTMTLLTLFSVLSSPLTAASFIEECRIDNGITSFLVTLSNFLLNTLLPFKAVASLNRCLSQCFGDESQQRLVEVNDKLRKINRWLNNYDENLLLQRLLQMDEVTRRPLINTEIWEQSVAENQELRLGLTSIEDYGSISAELNSTDTMLSPP